MLKRAVFAGMLACLTCGLASLGCSPPDRQDTGPGDRVDAPPSTPFPDARPVAGRADAPPFVELPDGGVVDPGLPGSCGSEVDCPAPDDCCFIFLEPPGVCVPGSVDPVLGCFPDI